jgi:hypothetical protein
MMIAAPKCPARIFCTSSIDVVVNQAIPTPAHTVAPIQEETLRTARAARDLGTHRMLRGRFDIG